MTKNLDKEGLSSIVDNYQLFYVDLWGVVHNGVSLHREAIKALKEITKIDKDYILLTNAPRPNTAVKSFLSDGIQIGNEQSFNRNGDNHVGWFWKGGTTSGIATGPSTTITPTAYSFSQTSGVSIIKYTGNGTLTDYSIPGGHTVDSVLVILDGLILPPADYSINSATLTFTNAPLNGQSIDIRYMPV